MVLLLCCFTRKTGILVFGPEQRESVRDVARSLAANKIPHHTLTASEVSKGWVGGGFAQSLNRLSSLHLALPAGKPEVFPAALIAFQHGGCV